MPRRLLHAARVLALLVAWPSLALAAGVLARFDLAGPTGGPFPADRFTVLDLDQNTVRLVSLPRPDCGARPSDCADINVLNTLDGFNLQPRLSLLPAFLNVTLAAQQRRSWRACV